MNALDKLAYIKKETGPKDTQGLNATLVAAALKTYPQATEAIELAYDLFQNLSSEERNILKLPEAQAIQVCQQDFLNFYKSDAVNPYIGLAGKGPWLVTAHGALIHDSGGYGMLGFGQNPDKLLKILQKPQLMANIMTASLLQRRFTDRLLKEVGSERKSKPFAKFLCLNSGSECVTVATRISDLRAKRLTDPGAKHEGKEIKFLAFRGSFHGRTERPAQASHSSQRAYQALASFRDKEYLDVIEPNNKDELINIFEQAKKSEIFYEMMLIEPVMGEGNPGVALDPEFYSLARKITRENDALLFADSIQAGLRAHGYVSVTDYPGFRDLDPPDMEAYSKALNGGQYPLSVLAMTADVAQEYQKGVYGNTMTGNPRALELACAALDLLTPEVRKNIQERGKEFLQRFKQLKDDFPQAVTGYAGTGLLCSLSLNEKGYTVLGDGRCVERELRLAGIGVIHGGKNALRFTPHFLITSQEIDMIIDAIRDALKKGPVYT